MRHGILATLIASTLVLAPAGKLISQEPEAGTPQEGDRWNVLRDKGLSLLKPTSEKIQSSIEQLLAEVKETYLPALKEAGYEVSEIEITVGLPTALTLHLRHCEAVGPVRHKELLAKYHGDAMVVTLLEALFATERVRLEGYDANEVRVSLGFPPSTTLVLTPVAAPR